jgi:YidC/Oxa1 family membrane protein insertase
MEEQGKRIVLFVVLAAAIFFGWQVLFPPEKPAKKPVATGSGSGSAAPTATSPTWAGGSGSGSGGVAPAAGSAAPAAGSGAPTVAPAPVEAPLPDEQTLELASPRFRLTFSNLGGTIKRVHRLVDPTKSGLVDDDLFISTTPAVGLLNTSFVNSTFPLSARTAWTGEKLSETKVRYTATTPAGLVVTKDFELLADDWMLKVVVEAKVPGAANQQLAVSMFGIAPEVDGQKKWPKRPWGKCNVGGSVKSASPAKVATSPVSRSGPIRFFGAATPYFMFAASPKPAGNESFECTTYPLATAKDGVQVDLTYPVTQLAAGDTLRKELFAYLGPAYHDRFERADEVAGFKMGLVDTVNFGWFSFIAKPLLWLLRALFGLVGNWGIAIILLTVLVKLATLYWTNKSMKSMKAMAALKPEMEALQKKYGDDRQKMQEAQMALFKRHGVNPLAGCLPMLLQMPIWMGLYQMLSHAGELHQAVFIPGWLTDLTERDPYFILPVALTGFMFLQSKLQPMTTTDSAQQKILMYGMPLMFGGMGLFFPAGLTVYITTNTLLGIAHTLYMKRSGDPVKPVAKPAEDDDAKATKADKAEAKPVKAEAKPAKPADADDDADSDDDDADDAESAPEPTAGKGGSTGGGGGKPKAGAQRRGQRKGKRR